MNESAYDWNGYKWGLKLMRKAQGGMSTGPGPGFWGGIGWTTHSRCCLLRKRPKTPVENMKAVIIWQERRTNKLNGQNLVTLVWPFQRLVGINEDGPRESKNKHSRKQAGNDNTFLKTRCNIEVPETRNHIPALAVSADGHSWWQVQVESCPQSRLSF